MEDFKVDDKYEQAYRAGYKAAEEKGIKMMDVIAKENSELRQELKVISEQNRKLRQAIFRSQEDYYD